MNPRLKRRSSEANKTWRNKTGSPSTHMKSWRILLVSLRAAGLNRHIPTTISTSTLLRSPAVPFPGHARFPTHKLGKGQWKVFSCAKEIRTGHHWLQPICFKNPCILLFSSLGHNHWPSFYVLQCCCKQSKSCVWHTFINRVGQESAWGSNARCYSGMENECRSSVALKNKPLEPSRTWLCQGGVVLRVFLVPESWVIASARRSKPNERWDFSFPCHPLTCFCDDARLLEQQVQPASIRCCRPTNERGSRQRTLYSHARLLSNAG